MKEGPTQLHKDVNDSRQHSSLEKTEREGIRQRKWQRMECLWRARDRKGGQASQACEHRLTPGV